jgi:hypothetical protein
MSWGGGWGGAYRPWGCCGGWYGGGYRGPVFINTGDINIGNNINVGNRTNIGNRIERNNDLNRDRSRANLYNRPENRDRLADRETATRNLNRARPATSRENNVFADRDGNVARQVGNDWQVRDNNQWTRPESMPAARDRAATSPRDGAQASRPAQRPASTRSFDRGGLDRASHARQTGANRQMARPNNMRGNARRTR